MHKKLITASVALVALAALALPALAQATNKPLVTHPTGTVLATPALVLATNTTESLLKNTVSGATELKCSVVTLTGTLTKNETGNVQSEISTASFTGTGEGGKCTGFINPTVDVLGLPYCLKATGAMVTDEFQVLGGKCTEAAKKIEFTLTTGLGKCRYQSTTTTALKGTFTTHQTGDAILQVPPTTAVTQAEKSAASGFTKVEDTVPFNPCPSSSYLEVKLTLETDTPPIASPLYISE